MTSKSQEKRLTAQTEGPLVNLVIERPAPVTDGTAMLERVKALTVTDATSYEAVAQVRQNARARWKTIEDQRVSMKAPSLEAGRRVDEFFKPVLAVFQEAGEIATKLLTNYDFQQRALAEQKQREADEKARQEREAAEAAARAERERQAALQRQQEREAAAQREREALVAKQAAEAAAAAEKAKRQLAEAAAAGDRQAKEAAEQAAAKARQEAVQARAAQLKAQEQAEASQRENERLQAESDARAQQLDQQAANVVAPIIRAETVDVAGLSRAKTYAWRLIDKSKLKADFLWIDEKAISALVRSSKQRAVEMVGAGSIEVYEESQLRQR